LKLKKVALKHAMLKYMEQTDSHHMIRNAKNSSYSRIPSNWWYLCLRHLESVIEVKNNGNIWVCSKETLDAVDFEILDSYERFKRRFE
jgi:hypothetical protein